MIFSADPYEWYPTKDRAVLTCPTSPRAVLSPLAFDALLIGLCTLYAIKTRNVPENFNEAKFIGFAMYTTCVTWIAFVPIYFGSETKVSSIIFFLLYLLDLLELIYGVCEGLKAECVGTLIFFKIALMLFLHFTL